MNKKVIIGIILRRAVEVFLNCVAISVFIAFLCVSGPMPVGSIQRDIALCVSPIIFVIMNVVQLRHCYFEIRNTSLYYMINLCAFVVFMIVNVGAYALLSREIYTWLFLITGFARFSSLAVATKISIALFHCIDIISVFMAPLGMGWVHRITEETFISEDMIPPVLTATLPKNGEEKFDGEKAM